MDTAMKTVAYLRVSTTRQDVQGQRLAILEYARKHNLQIDAFIEATASARTSPMRRRLDDLMDALEPGDRLVVSELSRLGRSLGQIVAMLDTLAREGIAFIAIKEQTRIEGKQDIQTKVMTTLFALFAEVERELISEPTREGLAKARSSGKKLGRPKGSLGVSRLDGKADEIRHFPRLGVSKNAIAKISGVSKADPVSIHQLQGSPAQSLACIYTRIWLVPWFEAYIRNNAGMIPNYADRHRYGERVSTGFVESAINTVVGKRFGKRQQMRWSKPDAHLMLQTRTSALDATLREKFEQWYPGRKNDDAAGKAEQIAA